MHKAQAVGFEFFFAEEIGQLWFKLRPFILKNDSNIDVQENRHFLKKIAKISAHKITPFYSILEVKALSARSLRSGRLNSNLRT
jgi:hypothetical protein